MPPPSKVAESESVNQLTIEQLAAESGMSVRNIRAHQARGLLDPPEGSGSAPRRRPTC
jgi:MerR HTH family regulatory protein